MNNFSNWLQERLDANQIRNLATHGAGSGWPGLTYTTNLVKLYQQHEEELWEALADDAENFGYASVPAFIATFYQADMTNETNGFKSLVVWYVAERTARRLADELEDEEGAI